MGLTSKLLQLMMMMMMIRDGDNDGIGDVGDRTLVHH